MKKEEIAGYNYRIANCNPSELITVLYDMYFSYEEDARCALQENNQEAYIVAMRQCSQIVLHLREVLDFTYDISKELFALYTYVSRCLARGMYSKKEKDILDGHGVMKSLQEAFLEVAKQDKREPIMHNSQQVTVGLTYGKNQLNESVARDIGTRGYWV